MGIPKFFNWIKYTFKGQRIITDLDDYKKNAKGRDERAVSSSTINNTSSTTSSAAGGATDATSINSSLPNPWLTVGASKVKQGGGKNNTAAEPFSAFDNLYLDLNALIHTSTHGDGVNNDVAVTPEIAIARTCEQIKKYVVSTIKPKKRLFLAIDGVAPAAKINQQRARRYRKVSETGIGDSDAGGLFDSNCISAGTEFMSAVSNGIRDFLIEQVKVERDLLQKEEGLIKKTGIRKIWSKLEIIFSGVDVPGEGEHKIMDFVRTLTPAKPGYDENEVHIMNGQDADMIILAMASLKKNFIIFREEKDYRRKGSKVASAGGATVVKYEVVDIPRFRQQLLKWMLEPQNGGGVSDLEKVDKDRVVLDFVFISYFVGNDFLPSFNSVYIPSGGMNNLLNSYNRMINQCAVTDSSLFYLVGDRFEVNMSRLYSFLDIVSRQEKMQMGYSGDQWLLTKTSYYQRCKNMEASSRACEALLICPPKAGGGGGGENDGLAAASSPQVDTNDKKVMFETIFKANFSRCMAEGRPKEQAASEALLIANEITSAAFESLPSPAAGPISNSTGTASDTPITSTIKESGTKLRSGAKEFKSLFPSSTTVSMEQYMEADKLAKAMCSSFMEGLNWCMGYYVLGVRSWAWSYPFHYAPTLADLQEFSAELMDEKVLTNFQRAVEDSRVERPVSVFIQLLAILPQASHDLLPACYREMLQYHFSQRQESKVSDNFCRMFPDPMKLVFDQNGKRDAYESVILLPFVEMQTLKDAVENFLCELNLTPGEKLRNLVGDNLLVHNGA